MSSTDQSNQDSRHDSDQINITSLKSEIDDLADNEAAQKQSFDVHKIDADLMQIDSILKALNSGTFDEGNMATIEQLTSIRPQNVISSGQLAPSHGLSLISQIESESSSSDSEGTSSEDEEDGRRLRAIDEDVETKLSKDRKYGYPMVKGEVDYRDIPSEDDETHIVCPDGVKLAPIGKVLHTTEKLTVIESFDNSPIINEGTVFWSTDRKYLGKLFEIFGPVKRPFYSIRVKDADSALPPDTVLYVAFEDPSLTQYVFTDEIIKQKGCDASWSNDHEVPLELQDYSDDEKEKLAKKVHLKKTDKTSTFGSPTS